ncbi:hypothetical protein ACVGVM_08090 [Pseudonocardia bannensis]|uniref:DUF3099 family protein n=1 Tax=Pseudonocardia bannensis TaxID=630973 RepID=A0A848DCU0_9PSEU|nr:hypothetical protein [Pseudonocardia bannensis]NMH90405.1 hypothetical protein [Pseudonocardia bannensis]
MRRRSRPAPAVVVTDLREPLIAVHRRMIRTRVVLMAIWILGWAATGFVYRTGWLAILILVVTGPVLWLAVFLTGQRAAPGPRVPVDRRRRALTPAERAAPGEAAGPR